MGFMSLGAVYRICSAGHVLSHNIIYLQSRVGPIICCVTKYPQTQWLKAINMYYLTVSVGWKLGAAYLGGGSLGCFSRSYPRCQPALQLSDGLAGLGLPFTVARPPTSLLVSQFWFWGRDLRCPPCGPLHRDDGFDQNMAACIFPEHMTQERVKWKPRAFYNLASTVTHGHFTVCYCSHRVITIMVGGGYIRCDYQGARLPGPAWRLTTYCAPPFSSFGWEKQERCEGEH